ncbi:MAG TPA: hypothetical protein VF988_17725 [Verrucomicrobiae bacterium]
MLFRKSKRSQERFYLLPGQGGRNFQRKQRVFLSWAVGVALLFGTVMAVTMWWLSRTKL